MRCESGARHFYPFLIKSDLELIDMSLKQISFKTSLSALALAFVTSTAMAGSLFSQAPIDGGDGGFSNVSAGAQNADGFTLSNAASITDLRWWGSYDTVDTDSFLIRILSNSAGSPGAIKQSYTTTAPGAATSLTDIAGAVVYQYDFHLPSALALTAGNYYLSVSNETTTASWYWLFGGGGDSKSWNRAADGDPWALAASDFAILIEGEISSVPGTVPEPETLALLAIGWVALGAGRAARKRRSGRSAT